MLHFKDIPANCAAIGTVEALLEAFFNVQHNEHVKAWRWEHHKAGDFHYSPQYSNHIIYGSRSND